eukprot:TRINITY_DN14964_c0_g1_i1.p1 TRINITY_DN14964_c0_g1~~TRINITY_DN14964_c0_g1_i1.p1  ORF type:complete len:161 (+),score=6.86 TRINITY_DN14964_c0_g1_i1:273-755(+)
MRVCNLRTTRFALAQSMLRQSCQAAEATSHADTARASISTSDGDMERVTGIEPASLGWEPRALPLSYTRPDRKPIEDARLPLRGYCIPSGAIGCKLVLRQATCRKSAQLSLAAMFHAAMRSIIDRHSLTPTSFTCYVVNDSCEPPCPTFPLHQPGNVTPV